MITQTNKLFKQKYRCQKMVYISLLYLTLKIDYKLKKSKHYTNKQTNKKSVVCPRRTFPISINCHRPRSSVYSDAYIQC